MEKDNENSLINISGYVDRYYKKCPVYCTESFNNIVENLLLIDDLSKNGILCTVAYNAEYGEHKRINRNTKKVFVKFNRKDYIFKIVIIRRNFFFKSKIIFMTENDNY